MRSAPSAKSRDGPRGQSRRGESERHQASRPRQSSDADRSPMGLEGRGLQKSFWQRKVVDSVNLVINPGEVVGLLGPNGAGKTTTFYMMVGLLAPDRGRILLDGADITALPMYRRSRRGGGGVRAGSAGVLAV